MLRKNLAEDRHRLKKLWCGEVLIADCENRVILKGATKRGLGGSIGRLAQIDAGDLGAGVRGTAAESKKRARPGP
jgi:hypothetical protein